MPQSKIAPPPQQRTFEFARTDLWRQLPAPARDECLRLIVRQLKEALESEHEEKRDEREDSI